ncbi:VOC family protein [Yinghuangia seranimata]|uniref:VOC family protein n=1 Tax=Yinghuangia seranimata TaxID=408067 RepID=UPI00248C8791|nr:VOC family protein [Yinghuangia seranimata]MDI2126602.1 VOC family protein [Yinghuangia seranimata]
MLNTAPVAGAPIWLDLGSRDIPAATAFYRAVLGWEYVSAGPEAGGYGMFTVDAKNVAAIGPLTEEGARSAWTIYFQTPDAEATTKAVEQAEGTVRMPAMDVMGLGYMAHYTDPTGGDFAVWQPGLNGGVDLVNAPGALTWTELFTGDVGGAGDFYREVLGWTYSDAPIPGLTYLVVATGTGDGDRRQGGVTTGSGAAVPVGWHPYFEVADCDAAVAAVTAHGGSVVTPVDDNPAIGRFALVADPEGARFAVITSAPVPA